jgi:hypothetical protein
MPRRPALVTQADIARALRAAKETGANSVLVGSDGVIRIVLTANAGSKPTDDLDEAWAPSDALRNHLKRSESG